LLPSRRERRERREKERHNQIISALDQITDHVKPSNVIPFPAPAAKDWNDYRHLGWLCQCHASAVRPFGEVRCWACGMLRPELTDEAIAQGKVLDRSSGSPVGPSLQPSWRSSPPPTRPTIASEYDPFSPEYMTR
jgi:hypothetical protein